MLKIRSSQIVSKMTSLHRARRHLSNDANDKSNKARMQKLWAIKVQVNQVKVKSQRGKKDMCHVCTVTHGMIIQVTWPHPKVPRGLIIQVTGQLSCTSKWMNGSLTSGIG
jgi:hypothetical protein